VALVGITAGSGGLSATIPSAASLVQRGVNSKTANTGAPVSLKVVSRLRNRMTTIDQLRADIDSHRTRDKVAGSDPAAAPLGTDEEAAGTPLKTEVVELARAREVGGSAPQNGGNAAIWIFLLFIVGFLGAITVGVWYLTSTDW
jgi:hypothetical protein